MSGVAIFTVLQLCQMYNERAETPTFDQGISGLYRYKHGIAGEQRDNEGMFLPFEVVKAVGVPPWEVAIELQQLTQQQCPPYSWDK